MKKKVAIIGAGFSGSIIAQRLCKGGLAVTVFEKSRGSGGRLSSNKSLDISFDLGLPYFESNNLDFTNWLTQQPSIQMWKTTQRNFLPQKNYQHKNYYVATPRQSALTRQLIDEADFRPNCKVKTITEHNGQFHITSDTDIDLGYFDSVIITAPARQTFDLLTSLVFQHPTNNHLGNIATLTKSLTYSSSWVLVIKTLATKEADVLLGDHPILARCVRQSAKPDRLSDSKFDIWTIEANQQWSEENIEPANQQVLITQAFLKTVSTEIVETIKLHRWLYAQHTGTNQKYLWDKECKLGCSSDWLSKTGALEELWAKANLLSDRIIKDLG